MGEAERKISPILEHDYRYLLERKKEGTIPVKDHPTFHAEERRGFGK